MMKLHRITRPLLILFVPVVVAACSNLPQKEKAITMDERAIARNLLYTLSMLDEVSPWQTAVQFSQAHTDFGQYVEEGLDELGYAVRRVSADQGKNYVRYASEQVQNETGSFTRYRIAIGSVSVERYFDQDGTVTFPVSAMTVEGASLQELVLNDEIFTNYDKTYSTLTFLQVGGNDVQTASGGAASVDASSANTTASTSNEQNVGDLPELDPSEKRNMYETRESNYSDVFASYDDVRRDVLVFPNDSLHLNDKNKTVIERFANGVKNDSDVISLIGCSHGKSGLNNGNSLLAIGRANRVKEALIHLGVHEQQVLDEGCWAPVHFDEMMPRRGVVITLKRRKA